LRELRERDWHRSIRDVARQQLGEEWARERLAPYYRAMKLFDEELKMLCKLAKNNFDLRHRDLGVVLYWKYKACGNPNCRTCYGVYRLHFPYPLIHVSLTEPPQELSPYKETFERESRVRREVLAQFLFDECGLLRLRLRSSLT